MITCTRFSSRKMNATFCRRKISRHFLFQKCVRVTRTISHVISTGYICASESLYRTIIEYMSLDIVLYYSVSALLEIFMIICTTSPNRKSKDSFHLKCRLHFGFGNGSILSLLWISYLTVNIKLLSYLL